MKDGRINMRCAYCDNRLKGEDRVVVFDSELVHDGECFTKYVRENFAAETTTYLDYLENELES